MPSPTRQDIVSTAQACIGVPFRLQASDPAFGLDCRGLLLHCYQAHGWQPLRPDITLDRRYRLGDGAKLRAVLEAECDEIALDAAQIADVVLLRDGPDREATHCGILTELPGHPASRCRICHAAYGFRAVVEHHIPTLELWRIAGVWRVKGID